MGRMFLRGKRFEPPRAGITAKAVGGGGVVLMGPRLAMLCRTPTSIALVEYIREATVAGRSHGVIYFDLDWSSLPSLLSNSLRRRDAWFFRTSIRSQVGLKMIKALDLKQIELDHLPQLALGDHSLSEPMGRAIERLDSVPLDSLLFRLARRYPKAPDAAEILRNSVLRAIATRALDAFYGQMWASSLGYKRVVFVGTSWWDKYLLDDREHGFRVTGSVSRACAAFGSVVLNAYRSAHRALDTLCKSAPTEPKLGLDAVEDDFTPVGKRSVLLVLNLGTNYGGLYTYDYLLSDVPHSPLHCENVIVIVRSGAASKIEGSLLGYPGTGNPLTQLRIRAAVLVKALASGGPRVPMGVYVHLAGVCSRIDGQRRELARRYPSLKLGILAYEIQVPSELVLALESLGIPTAALNERPQSLFWGLQPFSVSTLLTASSYFSDAAWASRSVSINNAVAMGMWRTDFLHEYRAEPPHEQRERARQGGQKFVVALPYHCTPPGEWSGNPLAVGVQPITHFLEDLADLAAVRPDIFITIRGKNDKWFTDERFSGIAARIDALPNIAVSRNYGAFNESYRLCAGADLVIAKHTSLVDEVLAVGIPCVVHDYTRNSRDLARPSVAYLPRGLWAENSREFRDAVDFALEDDGAAFREWWEPHRLRVYGSLNDGSVRARARAYLSALEQQGRS